MCLSPWSSNSNDICSVNAYVVVVRVTVMRVAMVVLGIEPPAMDMRRRVVLLPLVGRSRRVRMRNRRQLTGEKSGNDEQ